jgi:ATP-dependent Clp protease adapter protein ClpS
MHDVHAEAGHLQVTLHNDNETPMVFVIELLHSVFKKKLSDAFKLTEAIDRYGQAICGTYPRDAASELLEAARQHVRSAGHPLRITSEAVAEPEAMDDGRCKLCRAPSAESRLSLKGVATLICDDCMFDITDELPELTRKKQFGYACEALDWHFAGIPRDQLVATSRQFPGHMQADVQVAVDRLFSASPIRFFGIHEEHRYETLTIATLMKSRRNAQAIAPAQYHELDVGESAPVKCLNNGLWLCQTGSLRYAVVLSSASGVRP